MKVLFISNFLNHHQIPFCKAMQKSCDEFYFLSMSELTDERKSMGWSLDEKYDFELKIDEDKEKVDYLIENCDVVIVGGNRYIQNVSKRIESNKLTFVYSERILKKGILQAFSPNIQKFMIRDYTKYRKKNFHLLAASAYATFDFSIFGAFKEKAYKWGYFPQKYNYDVQKILSEKEENSILWVARFKKYKHPEKALKLAKKLKRDGIEFKLRMIGNGVLEEKMKLLSKRYGLENNVEFLGVMGPQEVRKYMEKSRIFLFTSNRGEGWGAVLNESMNSGCAVIADEHIGAAPYLVEDGQNGLLYSGSVNELYNKTKYLLQHKKEAEKLGEKAYKTIDECWNAEFATQCFISLSNSLLSNKEKLTIEEGPCSKA